MREILFKAKKLDNGEWVEGFLFVRKNTLNEIIDCFVLGDAYEQITDGQRYVRSNFNQECFRVIPESICQYTGLEDKSGNKIYENDIVKCYLFDCAGREAEFISDVFWSDLAWMLHEEKNCDGMLCYFDKNIKYESHVSEIEVIGNIFDNVELLEG